ARLAAVPEGRKLRQSHQPARQCFGQYRAGARFVGLQIVDHGGVGQGIGGVEQQGRPVGVLVDIILVGEAVHVLGVAVAAGDLGGQTQGRHVVHQGNVHRALDVVVVVVAHTALDVATELVGGGLGRDHHGPGHGVTAKQGALGALQNLNAAQVIGGDVGAGEVQGDVGKVVDHRIGRGADGHPGKAPQGDVHVAATALMHEADTGGDTGQVTQLADGAVFQHLR